MWTTDSPHSRRSVEGGNVLLRRGRLRPVDGLGGDAAEGSGRTARRQGFVVAPSALCLTGRSRVEGLAVRPAGDRRGVIVVTPAMTPAVNERCRHQQPPAEQN